MFNRVCLGAASLAVCGAAVLAAMPARAWTPDPALVGQLGPAVPVIGGRVRPPKGYAEQAMGADAMSAWAGETRADGTRVLLVFERLTPGPKTRRMPLALAFATLIGVTASHHTRWTVTPTEAGAVGGMPFVRCRWRGVDARTGQPAHGLEYLGRRGTSLFLLKAQLPGPEDRKALALAEASCLTFRAK